MSDEDAGDGVNRVGLDYRAGYCEGLVAILRQLQVMALRASKRGESEVLERVHATAKKLREEMLDKMRGK